MYSVSYPSDHTGVQSTDQDEVWVHAAVYRECIHHTNSTPTALAWTFSNVFLPLSRSSKPGPVKTSQDQTKSAELVDSG